MGKVGVMMEVVIGAGGSDLMRFFLIVEYL